MRTLDLTNLPLETALSVAAADMDRAVSDALVRCGDLLLDLGATNAELAEFLAPKAAELAEWRAKSLAELRAWLQRGGESLN
jgi:hypothetical protein